MTHFRNAQGDFAPRSLSDMPVGCLGCLSALFRLRDHHTNFRGKIGPVRLEGRLVRRVQRADITHI